MSTTSVQGLKGARSDSKRTDGGVASVMMSLLKIGSCLGVGRACSPSKGTANVALTTIVSLGLASASSQWRVAAEKDVSLQTSSSGIGRPLRLTTSPALGEAVGECAASS